MARSDSGDGAALSGRRRVERGGGRRGANEAAVGARNMSARLDMRLQGETRFGRAAQPFAGAANEDALETALLTGKILCYAQGFAMLAQASESFGWNMPLAEIARIWRAGCIIRSAMLDDMASALEHSSGNLVFDNHFAALVATNIGALRATVVDAIGHGHAVPALSAGLAWFDQLCMARSTANLIQGQRDFFGLHGFRRLDRDGDFHGPWAS